MVKTVQKQIFQQRCIRWIMKWRRFTAMRIRRRKENQTFPAGPSHLLLGQQVLSLKSKGETSSLKRKSVMENSVNVKRVNYLSGNVVFKSLAIYLYLNFTKLRL